MYRIRPNHCALIIFVGIIFTSMTTRAIEIMPTVSLAMQYTDNVRRVTNTNEEDDLILITSVGANLDADSGPFQLDADFSLRDNNYTHDTFDRQHYFNLNAIANWVMLRDQLDWKFQDFFTQQSVNSLSPHTPDNIGNTNVLTFGPNIYFRISGRQLVTLTPEYREFSYEIQNLDNRQNSLNASWNYQLFRTVNVGVRGGENKVDYENQLIIDSIFKNIHLTLSTIRQDYNYSVDLGSTHAEKNGSEGIRGTTGNIRFMFNITGSSNLRANISSDLTDTNNNLLNASANPDGGNFASANPDGGNFASANPDRDYFSNEQISSEVFRNSVFKIAYLRNNATLNSEIWIELRKQDYEFELLDQEVKAAGFDFNYPLTALLSTGFNTRYSRIDLNDIGRKDTEYNIGGNIKYRFSRKLHSVANLSYYETDSSVDSADFSETRVFISLVYGR